MLKLSQTEREDAPEAPAERVRRAVSGAGVVWTAMVATDERGDIDARGAPSDGYFFEDTRLLSVCRLLLDRRGAWHLSQGIGGGFFHQEPPRPPPPPLRQRPPPGVL